MLRSRGLRKTLYVSCKRSFLVRFLLAHVFSRSLSTPRKSELFSTFVSNGHTTYANSKKTNLGVASPRSSRLVRKAAAFQKIKSFWIDLLRFQKGSNRYSRKRKFLQKRRQLLFNTPKIHCQLISNLLLTRDFQPGLLHPNSRMLRDSTSEPSLHTYLSSKASYQTLAKSGPTGAYKFTYSRANFNHLTVFRLSSTNEAVKVTDSLPLTFPMKPLYSLMFVASPFSFLTHMLSSTSGTSDIIRATRSTRRYFKHLVFPDADAIRASVFRRLNRQKLLFQARTRMTSAHFAKSKSHSRLSPLVHPYGRVEASAAPVPSFQDHHTAGSFTSL